MTAISASRRKTINRVLEVCAGCSSLCYNGAERIGALEARFTGEKANAGTRRRQAKKFWVRQWLLRRPLYEQYEKLMAEMKADDPAVLSGANAVQTRCLRQHHGVNTV